MESHSCGNPRYPWSTRGLHGYHSIFYWMVLRNAYILAFVFPALRHFPESPPDEFRVRGEHLPKRSHEGRRDWGRRRQRGQPHDRRAAVGGGVHIDKYRRPSAAQLEV